MRIRALTLLLAWMVACTAWPTHAQTPAPAAHGPDATSALTELKSLPAPGGKITAHFLGEAPPEPNTPPEYAVHELRFTFAGNPDQAVFHPQGTLYFSDWYFPVFSPDGRYVLLLQDHYGPFHAVQTGHLAAYLAGKEAPMAVIWADDAPRLETHPARVHGFVEWVGPGSFELIGNCCGDEYRYVYDIESRMLAPVKN